MHNQKKIIFSGVQPSGNLHIGNYLGAIKQFVKLQEETDAIFCVVDLHAVTIPQDPNKLRAKTFETAMIYLAAGIDPKKSVIFVQSHVPAHTELSWILNTMTPIGELERMTQFKEKSGKTTRSEGVMAGLLNYPTLMAADILLYQTDMVPVGEDQKQHVELTRSIAERFNNRFGKTFEIPQALVDNNTKRIMGLDDPAKKMSKSAESANNYISMLEEPDEIRRKIKIAVTDSESEIGFDPANRPAVANLMHIYSAFSGITTKDVIKKYAGKGYAEFKKDLAEVVISGLKPIQENYSRFSKDKNEVLKILRNGAKKASERAEKTLKDVKEKMGLL